ncbi:MAG: hypothetical protein PWR32_118 [Candidatus Woesearchaeota archaeon]|nr:hypothetical protein [Candidatus Woesearchaeota archaeon]
MAKKKMLKYTLNGKRRAKQVLVPDRAIKVTLESSKPMTQNGKKVVKISYLPSRKESAKKRIKYVAVPKDAENIKLL